MPSMGNSPSCKGVLWRAFKGKEWFCIGGVVGEYQEESRSAAVQDQYVAITHDETSP